MYYYSFCNLKIQVITSNRGELEEESWYSMVTRAEDTIYLQVPKRVDLQSSQYKKKIHN